MFNRVIQFIIAAACTAGGLNNAYSDSQFDIQAGKKIYTQCTGCHTYSYHRTGPKHCGLIGRRAGSADGFKYTQAMKKSGIVWTKTTLNRFLESPIEVIPGTSMGYSGISSMIERRQLIAFLASLKDSNSLCR